MASPEGQVAETCQHLLTMELVRYVIDSEVTDKTQEHGGAAALETTSARLDRLGFQVGQRLIERCTRDRPRFLDTLEIIKFVCKELWVELFLKQVDNLRTNHRGVYVLQDHKFRWLSHFSGDGDVKELAAKHILFPCGVIRGALSSLGVHAAVSAELLTMPGVSFTIKVKQ